jgi:hypothetical protein
MAEKTQRDRDLEKFQRDLDKSIAIEALQSMAEWNVVNEVINGLVSDLSSKLVNGEILDHDQYVALRNQLEGVRAVYNRLETIKKNGKQASNAIRTISE